MYKYICKNCSSEFQTNHKNQIYCSRKCSGIATSKIKDYRELIGKKFGRLVVVERDRNNTRHPHLICNCDCGKQISVNIEHILSGRSKSCGCLRIEKTFVEDTSINLINSKVRKDNTSGVKGVVWRKKGKKWMAQIGFRGKGYNLGYYSNLEDAIKARKEAEEKYFRPILEKYSK